MVFAFQLDEVKRYEAKIRDSYEKYQNRVEFLCATCCENKK